MKSATPSRIFAGLVVWGLALMVLCHDASARPRTIADISQSRIDIAYSFAGADLLVFGAVEYDGSSRKKPPDVAIVVRGPTQSIVVRRRERLAGIWVNRRSLRFETAPGFYAVASTAPVDQLLSARMAAIYEIGLPHLQLSPVSRATPAEILSFEEGFIAERQSRGLYIDDPHGVEMRDGILYRARIAIPATAPVGVYDVEVHLIADGRVINSAARRLSINKIGFDRAIYVAAQDHAFLYGLGAVLLALFLGWLANSIVKRRWSVF